MSNGWTKGPWRVGVEGNNRVYGPDSSGADSGLIAVVYKGAGNKHLIAAAPELAEALEAVLPYLGEGYMPDEADDEPVGWTADSDGTNQRPMALTFGMVRRARAALAKARGGHS